MIESHSDTAEFLADLKVSLFCNEKDTLKDVKNQLSFVLEPDSKSSIFLAETMTVDWNWAADEDHFVLMPEVNRFYAPGAVEYEAAEAKSSEWSALGFTNLYLRVKALIEIDRRYEWDFDDEEGMDDFEEKVNGPFYVGLRPNFGDLRAAWYDLSCYSNPGAS